jgi:hypothetical protein
MEQLYVLRNDGLFPASFGTAALRRKRIQELKKAPLICGAFLVPNLAQQLAIILCMTITLGALLDVIVLPGQLLLPGLPAPRFFLVGRGVKIVPGQGDIKLVHLDPTGVSILTFEAEGKRQDILIEAVPGLRLMAVVGGLMRLCFRPTIAAAVQ